MSHTIKATLDHQRGGWLASCSCGWQAKRPCWYKARALDFGQAHLEAVRR